MNARIALGLCAALVAAPALAHAGDDADSLYKRGRALMQQRRYAEACPALAESVKLEPGIGAHLWLGECYEKSAQLPDAWREFKAAEKAALAKKDDRAKVAQRRAGALEPKLTRLAVIASSGDDEIKLDGAVVATSDLGAPQPVAAGVHTIAATAAGKTPWSVTITIPTQPNLVTVNVPVLEDAPVAPVDPAPAIVRVPVVVTESASERARPRGPWLVWRVASLGLGAIGVAALGGGAFIGLEAKSKYDSSNANGHCVGNACDPAGKEARSDATRLASKSTALFATGLGVLGAGIAVFVLTPSTTVTPTIGGASLTHRF